MKTDLNHLENTQRETGTAAGAQAPSSPRNVRRGVLVLLAVLLGIFTLALALDIVNYVTFPRTSSPGADFDPSGTDFPDFDISDFDISDAQGEVFSRGRGDQESDTSDPSEFSRGSLPSGDFSDGDLPSGDFSGGEMPSGDLSDGSMPSGDFSGGSMPSGDFSGEIPSGDFSRDTDFDEDIDPGMTLQQGGTVGRGPLYGVRSGLRNLFVPLLVVCILGDVVCLALLLWLLLRRRPAGVPEANHTESPVREVPAEETGSEITPTEGAQAQGAPAEESQPVELGPSLGEEEPVPRRRHHRWWIVVVVILVVLIVLLAILPRLARGGSGSVTVVSQVRSGTAEEGEISQVLSGAGTLTAQESVSLSLPDSVTLSGYYVENGDTAAAGDPIAQADLTSVAYAIVQLQETLDQLDLDLAEAAEEEAASVLTATASGRVMALYAQEGVSLADTVVEDGCLMRLSLDGLLAVDLEDPGTLSVGDGVTVQLADGSDLSGRVDRLRNGTLTVTVSDEEAALDDVLTVYDASGALLGTGAAYIHSELQVLGYSGTVSEVAVSVGDTVESGDTLLTLEDTGPSALYVALLAQRAELEDTMDQLFTLSRDGIVYADTAGVVSGIPEDAQLLTISGETDAVVTDTSATVPSFVLNLLTAETAEEPAQDEAVPEEEPEYSAEELTAVLPWAAGFALMAGLDADLEAIVPYDPDVFLQVLVEPGDLDPDTPGAYTLTLLFLARADTLDQALGRESEGSGYRFLTLEVPVWVLAPEEAEAWLEEHPDLPLVTEDDLSEEEGPEASTDTPAQEVADTGTQPQEQEQPDTRDTLDTGGSGSSGKTDLSDGSGLTGTQDSSGFSGFSGMGGTSGFSGLSGLSGGTDGTASSVLEGLTGLTEEEEEQVTSYTVGSQTLLSVTPQDTMTVTITVDELDILSLSEGLEAELTLDALPSRSFVGTVTEISATGTNSGGNTKFTVEVTLPREAEMLEGMNASVHITLSAVQDVVTIPEAALTEEGGQVLVYTGYDSKSDRLTDPVEVETGASDGERVEIRSGLSLGDTYYYRYADTLTYTFSGGLPG